MRSRIPSHIRWKGHKKMEELLDDPLAESLYGLFLKAKSSPIHIAFKPKHLQFPLKKIFKMMRSIKSRYNHCCHWKERQSVIVDTEPILDQTTGYSLVAEESRGLGNVYPKQWAQCNY